ncbi:hypothetical protein Tco_0597124 [Tanacetum coccineum]
MRSLVCNLRKSYFCTKLQQRVLDLENTKTAQAQEITSLKKRVKKLKKKGGSRTHKLKRLYRVGRSRRVVSSEEESLGDQEDASKQGRIDDIDADKDIYLVNVDRDEDMFGVNDLEGDKVIVESEVADVTPRKIGLAAERYHWGATSWNKVQVMENDLKIDVLKYISNISHSTH